MPFALSVYVDPMDGLAGIVAVTPALARRRAASRALANSGVSSRRAVSRCCASNALGRSVGGVASGDDVVGVTSKPGVVEAVVTATAPWPVIVRFANAELSGFPWNATNAYSAPLVEPLRQMPLPLTPGTTCPGVSVVAAPDAQASAVVDDPAVTMKSVESAVPATLALIVTVPGDPPSVTWVFA